jgi:hypothetical protein
LQRRSAAVNLYNVHSHDDRGHKRRPAEAPGLAPECAWPVERLLEAARQRVAETNVRRVAEEIGMDHSGLRKLLRFRRKPQAATMRKLPRWYLNGAAAGLCEIPAEIAQIILSLLVRHLPSAQQPAAIQAVIDTITGFENASPTSVWITNPRPPAQTDHAGPGPVGKCLT